MFKYYAYFIKKELFYNYIRSTYQLAYIIIAY